MPIWTHLAVGTRTPDALESFSISRAITLQIPPIFHLMSKNSALLKYSCSMKKNHNSCPLAVSTQQ